MLLVSWCLPAQDCARMSKSLPVLLHARCEVVQAVQEHLACVCPNANAHVQDRWQSQPMVLCSGEKPGTRSKKNNNE